MAVIEARVFPDRGYPNLDLGEVFMRHGVVHGLTELDRRAEMVGDPPKSTSKAEVAAEIIHNVINHSLEGVTTESVPIANYL